mgnify:CR=1 FL=1
MRSATVSGREGGKVTDEELLKMYTDIFEDTTDDSWNAKIAHLSALRAVYEKGLADGYDKGYIQGVDDYRYE